MPVYNAHLKFKYTAQAGFTLIELMVTVAIVVLVTGIVMVQYSAFNSSVLLTNQAYLTAFDLRETQSLAIGVRGDDGNFYSAYGVYLDLTASNPNERNEYLLFQDDISNGVQDPIQYTAGVDTLFGAPYKLGPRFKLVNICATDISAKVTCYTDDPLTSGETINPALHDMSISFVRPNFDAQFYNAAVPNISSVKIVVGTMDSAKTKSVSIYNTGQISIQ